MSDLLEITEAKEPEALEKAMNDLEVAQNNLQLARKENEELKQKLTDVQQVLEKRAMVLKDMNEALVTAMDRAERAEEKVERAEGSPSSYGSWRSLPFEAVADLVGRLFPGRHIVPNPETQTIDAGMMVHGELAKLTIDYAAGKATMKRVHGPETVDLPGPMALVEVACDVH
jgi:hypothetical protein